MVQEYGAVLGRGSRMARVAVAQVERGAEGVAWGVLKCEDVVWGWCEGMV
jgi:hypothetical protein